MAGQEAFPVLSLQERNRRWNRTRAFLKKKGFECLLLAGLTSREQYDAYLTNDYAEGIVVFPAEVEPTYITWQEGRVTRQKEAAESGITPWVEDMRIGVDPPTVAACLASIAGACSPPPIFHSWSKTWAGTSLVP